MSTSTLSPGPSHVIVRVETREYRVPADPVNWPHWSFGEKLRWVEGNAAPKPDRRDACAILRRRAMAKVLAREAKKHLPCHFRRWVDGEGI
jgi:hypothetical protein